MCSNPKNQPKEQPTPKEESPAPAADAAKAEAPKAEKKEETTPSIRHRGKRESYAVYAAATGRPLVAEDDTAKSQFVRKKPKKQSKAKQKHGADGPSGGLEALIPSLIGVAILVCAIMAKMGFRGRAEVAGIDLGTTNSVICVQQPSKGVGIIECMSHSTVSVKCGH